MERQSSTLLRSPLQDILDATSGDNKTVLLCGIGGGYDIYNGVPLCECFRAQGRKCVLVNFTFVSFDDPVICKMEGVKNILPKTLWSVSSRVANVPSNDVLDSGPTKEKYEGLYFPELYLSQYLQGEEIFVIERHGPVPTERAYLWLLEHVKPACVVAVDGGTDSLMFGDEESLGSPEEDMASLAGMWAALKKTSPHPIECFLFCVGYGVDAYHGVSHNLFLENVSTLARDSDDDDAKEKRGGFLGCFSLLPHGEEFASFRRAFRYATSRQQTSIVCGSVLYASQGSFGHAPFTDRTGGSPLFLNPLMSLYWVFRVDVLARHHLFMCDEDFLRAHTRAEVQLCIKKKRATMKIRPATPFPH